MLPINTKAGTTVRLKLVLCTLTIALEPGVSVHCTSIVSAMFAILRI